MANVKNTAPSSSTQLRPLPPQLKALSEQEKAAQAESSKWRTAMNELVGSDEYRAAIATPNHVLIAGRLGLFGARSEYEAFKAWTATETDISNKEVAADMAQLYAEIALTAALGDVLTAEQPAVSSLRVFDKAIHNVEDALTKVVAATSQTIEAAFKAKDVGNVPLRQSLHALIGEVESYQDALEMLRIASPATPEVQAFFQSMNLANELSPKQTETLAAMDQLPWLFRQFQGIHTGVTLDSIKNDLSKFRDAHEQLRGKIFDFSQENRGWREQLEAFRGQFDWT